MTMYLYSKVRQVVTLAMATVVISPMLQAQYRAAQPERKTPRAVGVLETFPNGMRRLVPVTFFYERRYYDATFYHATPVPFTLYPETVYEVQQFGQAIGTFTVLSASQSTAENAKLWFGTGHFKVAPDPALLAKKRAAARPVVVVADSSRPVLHRRAGGEGDNPVAHPAATETNAAADDDPERPKLHRREGSGDSSAGTATATATATATPTAPSTATPTATATPSPGAMEAAGTEAAKAGAGAELTPSDDPEHPILRHGKPTKEQSGPDLPEFEATGKNGGALRSEGGSGGRSEEAVTRQVAVSDAGASEAHGLIYVCRDQERKEIEASARELAEAELRRLAAQRGLMLPASVKAAPVKAPGSAKAGSAKKSAAASGRSSGAAAAPELRLEEEQFIPYELDYNNYATVIFSARYAPEETSGGTASDAASVAAKDAGAAGAGGPSASAASLSAKGRSWVVTVIAREDEGKLVKLYSAVSDPRELDLYPEVRLVDAVDPDGYGRYGLLLREQKRDGVSWLLGRPTGYELLTVFETAAR
jgi:hypothetical protein